VFVDHRRDLFIPGSERIKNLHQGSLSGIFSLVSLLRSVKKYFEELKSAFFIQTV
jgi:hypothetical protein